MENQQNQGTVISVRGSVIDARFAPGRLPDIGNVLLAGDDGRTRVEVMVQINAETVRGISLMPTQGLARGSAITDTGGPFMIPVAKSFWGGSLTSSERPSTISKH